MIQQVHNQGEEGGGGGGEAPLTSHNAMRRGSCLHLQNSGTLRLKEACGGGGVWTVEILTSSFIMLSCQNRQIISRYSVTDMFHFGN